MQWELLEQLVVVEVVVVEVRVWDEVNLLPEVGVLWL